MLIGLKGKVIKYQFKIIIKKLYIKNKTRKKIKTKIQEAKTKKKKKFKGTNLDG